jgi:pullulanase
VQKNSGNSRNTLPAGSWSICINGSKAGTEVLDTVSSSVGVAGISAMVLVQGELAPEHTHD